MRKEERMKEYDLCHLTSLVMLTIMTECHQETQTITFSAFIVVARDTRTISISQIFTYNIIKISS